MLPNWLYGKSKSKLATILGGGGTPADYNEVKAQVTRLTQDSVTWDVLSEVGAVNYAPNNLVTQTVSEANFTVTHNVDDSITVYSDGVTKSWSIEICSITIKAGRYILKGTGTDNIKFQVVDNPIVHELYSAGVNDVIMTFATDTAIKLRVSVFNGKSYDNIVIYPMIAPFSYNGPYVPYAKSNKALTDDVGNLFVVSSRTGNVFDITIDGGYGGNDYAKALILGSTFIGIIGYYSNKWNYIDSITIKENQSITQSNNSSTGLRLTLGGSADFINIFPINLGSSHFKIAFVS